MRVSADDVAEDVNERSSSTECQHQSPGLPQFTKLQILRLLQKLFDRGIRLLLELRLIAVYFFRDGSSFAQLKSMRVNVEILLTTPDVCHLLNPWIALVSLVSHRLGVEETFRLAILQRWHVVEGGLDGAGWELC